MSDADSRELINYFKNKEGKYLHLSNGKETKLRVVGDWGYSLTLTFTYSRKVLVIVFSGLYKENVTMHTTEEVVKIDNLQSMGYALENVLTNWTERKDDVIELNWED